MYYLELAGEDDNFALAEATLACANPEVIAPGVARATQIDCPLAKRLAQTHTIIDSVTETTGDLDALVEAVESTTFDGEGTIAVRATSVRGLASIDIPEVERVIGQVLVDAGFTVDLDEPDRTFRILVTENGDTNWYCGWVVVEPDRSFGPRRPPERPFRQPGTMRPQLARSLVNLSGVRADEVLLDPMCGAGAILMEAALMEVRTVGLDLQQHMIEGARANVAAYANPELVGLFVRGSASHLPISHADVAVFDAPYGRQSPIGFESAPALVSQTLSELEGVVDRCVVVFDRAIEEQLTETDWTVKDRFTHRVHRSLDRHILVLG